MSLPEIIEFTAILYHIGALDVLQINDIEANVFADMAQRFDFGSVDYAYQRMGSFYTQKIIVFFDRIQLYNLLHNSGFHCFTQIYKYLRAICFNL